MCIRTYKSNALEMFIRVALEWFQFFCSMLPGVKANAKIRRDNRFNGPAYIHHILPWHHLYNILRGYDYTADVKWLVDVVSSINLLCEEKIYFDSPSSYLALLPNADGKSIQDPAISFSIQSTFSTAYIMIAMKYIWINIGGLGHLCSNIGAE